MFLTLNVIHKYIYHRALRFLLFYLSLSPYDIAFHEHDPLSIFYGVGGVTLHRTARMIERIHRSLPYSRERERSSRRVDGGTGARDAAKRTEEEARGKTVRATLSRASSCRATSTPHSDHGRPPHSAKAVMVVWPWCVGIVDGPFRTEPPRGPPRDERAIPVPIARGAFSLSFSLFLRCSLSLSLSLPRSFRLFLPFHFDPSRPLVPLLDRQRPCRSPVHLPVPFGSPRLSPCRCMLLPFISLSPSLAYRSAVALYLLVRPSRAFLVSIVEPGACLCCSPHGGPIAIESLALDYSLLASPPVFLRVFVSLSLLSCPFPSTLDTPSQNSSPLLVDTSPSLLLSPFAIIWFHLRPSLGFSLARFSSRSLSGARSLRSPFLFRGAQPANDGSGLPREPTNAGGTSDGFLNHFYANTPRPLCTCTHDRTPRTHCESTLVTRRAYVCENTFCQDLTLASQTLPLPVPTIFTLRVCVQIESRVYTVFRRTCENFLNQIKLYVLHASMQFHSGFQCVQNVWHLNEKCNLDRTLYTFIIVI